MAEQLAIYLSNILIGMGTAQEKERPFLIYGLFCIISGSLQIVLLLAVSLLFNTMIQTAVYAFCFGILKRTIGGWHAKHHFSCLALFTSLSAGCVLAGQWLPQSLVLPVTLLLTAAMGTLVWWKAPVEHPNNPQTPARLAQLRRDSRCIAGSEAVVIVVLALLLYRTPLQRLALDAAIGSFTAAFALLVPNALPPESQKGG